MAGPYRPSSIKNYLGFGLQSSKGTGVAPTVFLPYMGAVGLGHGQSGSQIREAGSGLFVTRTLKEKHDPGGQAAAAFRPSALSTLLAWFLGADAITGAGPYTHTLTPAEATTWLSIEQNLEDEVCERFVDGFIKKMVLSGEDAKDLMVSLEWGALTPEWRGSATAESYDTGVDAAPFKQDEATFTVDGSGATNVRRWELELAWTFDEDIRLASVSRADALKMKLEAKLTLRQLMQVTTNYRTVNYGSASGSAADDEFFRVVTDGFVAAFDNGEATTDNRQITLTVPQLEYLQDAEYSALNPDGNEAVYLDRVAVATKKAATELVTAVAITGDSSAYVS